MSVPSATPAPRRFPVRRSLVQVLAAGMALSVAWLVTASVAISYLSIPPAFFVSSQAPVGALAVYMWVMSAWWWARILASYVLAVLLAASWRGASGPSRRGLVRATLGLLLTWGWWALGRVVDLWGFRRFDGPTPEATRVAIVSELVYLSIQGIAVWLLVSGAVVLLRGHERAPVPGPTARTSV